MDAGAHPVGGAELRHPDEHVDAQLLRPGEVDLVHQGIEERHARRVGCTTAMKMSTVAAPMRLAIRISSSRSRMRSSKWAPWLLSPLPACGERPTRRSRAGEGAGWEWRGSPSPA